MRIIQPVYGWQMGHCGAAGIVMQMTERTECDSLSCLMFHLIVHSPKTQATLPSMSAVAESGGQTNKN